MPLPRAMSESLVLQQPVSMTPVIPEGNIYSCPGSGQPQETLMVSQSHTAIRAQMIWVACATGKAMSGSVVLRQQGSVMISMAPFTTRSH